MVNILPGTESHSTDSSYRYSLNYKGLPYKTVWIEYPDVEPTLKKIGAPPTGRKLDGSPLYTIPTIYDDSTGTAITDSALIAEYLDETYPSTPRVIPPGTHALQGAFRALFSSKAEPLVRLLMPDIPLTLLNPRSIEHFEKYRSEEYGIPTLEALRIPSGDIDAQWEKVKVAFGSLDELLKKDDVYVMGNTPSLADFAIGGWLNTAKASYGKESEEWKKIMSWHGGRWERLMTGLDQYSANL